MKYFISFSIIIFVFFSCNKITQENETSPEANIFSDSIVRKIYDAKNNRNTQTLLTFLTHEKPEYRRLAALSFASVQDTSAKTQLFSSLNDIDEEVRINAAFALGQLFDTLVEQQLIKAFESESSLVVQKNLLEAIGKCGTSKGLAYIAVLQKLDHTKIQYLTGQSLALFRFAARGIYSEASSKIAVGLLGELHTDEVREFAANYFTRIKDIDISAYIPKLIEIYKKEEDVEVKIPLIRAFGQAVTTETYTLLGEIIKSNKTDYREKINALLALRSFQYIDASSLVFLALEADNLNVQIAASEYFLANGAPEGAERYFTLAQKTENWRVRANLLNAALKNSPQKISVSNYILELYNNTDNDYEKGFLLLALANDSSQLQFISQQIDYKTTTILNTYALEALTLICENSEQQIFDSTTGTYSPSETFKILTQIFKEAVKSKDVAVISLAAIALRNPDSHFNSTITNFQFLTEALNSCVLPRDIEAYNELQQTAAFFTNRPIEQKNGLQPQNIDWKIIAALKQNETVKIETTKGTIKIALLVNEAPATVSSFVKLIQEGYFNNKFFHRVVPNFVVQTGCNRGDGWGSPDYSIRSEFSQLTYETGFVGMASAGKDTEGSQWFITNSPTPHLDGRYTIFAKLTDGLDVIENLEIGDKILNIEIPNFVTETK